MKITGADLPKIQASLFVMAVMVIIGGGAVYASLAATQKAKLAQAAAQAQRSEIDRKLKRLINEESEVKRDSALFNQLQIRGVVGEERRLDWIEEINAIRDKRKLIDLQYELAPQRPLDGTPVTGFGYYASAMKLQLKLLHEEDLLRLISDLHQQASALTQPKSCNVWRLSREAAEPGLPLQIPAQLGAECQIDWITLREATSQ